MYMSRYCSPGAFQRMGGGGAVIHPEGPPAAVPSEAAARVARATLAQVPDDERGPEGVSEINTVRAPARRRGPVEAPEA